MPFDAQAHEVLVSSMTTKRDQLRAHLKEVLGDINPNSSSQLAEWLTGALEGPESPQYQAWPKTATGRLKTGRDELLIGLTMLSETDQCLVKNVLLPLKQTEKLLSSFGANLVNHLHPVTGRLHASYRLTGTQTGRLSCSQPNLQQIPHDADFRRLFAPKEGRRLVIADYSQIELRVAALIACEERLLEAYRKGEEGSSHIVTF